MTRNELLSSTAGGKRRGVSYLPLLIMIAAVVVFCAGCPEEVPDETDETIDVLAPPTVQLFAAEASTLRVKLTWDVVDKEDLTDESSSYYAGEDAGLPAYIKDTSGVLIARWDNQEPDFYPERGEEYAAGDAFGGGVVVAVLPKETQEFSDQTITAGETYFYEAFTFDKIPNYSQPALLNATPGSLAQGRLSHTQTNLSDGEVLLCGGLGSSGPLDTAEIFDPDTDSFRPLLGKLNTERFGHTATLLTDGRVLIVGGYKGAFEQTLATAEIFDPATESFGRVESELEIGVALHTATLLPDGRVLIVGGTDGVDALGQIAVFDPTTLAFTALEAELPHPRYGQQAVLYNDTVYILGGFDGERTLRYVAAIHLPDFNVTDLDGDAGEAQDMLTARVNHTVSEIDEGRWIVIGGTQGSLASAQPVSSSEIFDPAAENPFVASGDLDQARSGHTAVALNDGTVLVAGGIDADMDILDSAEIYDPSTGAFTETGSMRLSRTVHAASLLPDGRVLVTGGNRSVNLFLPEPASTAEIFDPATGAFTVVGVH